MASIFEKMAGLFTKKTPPGPSPTVAAASPRVPGPVAGSKAPFLPASSAPAQILLSAKPVQNVGPGMLTKNFSLAEVTASGTARGLGIDNSLPANLAANVRIQAALMQLVRDKLGAPVQISSWYRCPKLNAAVGGVPNSAHVLGLACDFECPAMGDPLTVARMVETMLDAHDVEFDQLIHEGGWVHLAVGPGRRRQRLTILGGPAKTGLLTAAEYKGA